MHVEICECEKEKATLIMLLKINLAILVEAQTDF